MTLFGAPLKNVGLFAAVLVGASIVVVAIVFVLDSQFGFDGSTAGAWIGPLAVATVVAGRSYAEKSNWGWSAADRRRLATAYSITSVVISAVFAIASILLDPSVLGGLSSFWAVFVLVLGSAFGGLISYGIALALLAYAVRPKATKAATNSSTAKLDHD